MLRQLPGIVWVMMFVVGVCTIPSAAQSYIGTWIDDSVYVSVCTALGCQDMGMGTTGQMADLTFSEDNSFEMNNYSPYEEIPANMSGTYELEGDSIVLNAVVEEQPFQKKIYHAEDIITIAFVQETCEEICYDEITTIVLAKKPTPVHRPKEAIKNQANRAIGYKLLSNSLEVFGENINSVELLDVRGRVISAVSSNGKSTRISTRGISKGVYMLRVSGPDETSFIKITR